jgi:hypothetical protein
MVMVVICEAGGVTIWLPRNAAATEKMDLD